jgi:hypothetical protein
MICLCSILFCVALLLAEVSDQVYQSLDGLHLHASVGQPHLLQSFELYDTGVKAASHVGVETMPDVLAHGQQTQCGQ